MKTIIIKNMEATVGMYPKPDSTGKLRLINSNPNQNTPMAIASRQRGPVYFSFTKKVILLVGSSATTFS